MEATFLKLDQLEVCDNPFLEMRCNQKEEQQESKFTSPRDLAPVVTVPQGIYQESKMLGSGKN